MMKRLCLMAALLLSALAGKAAAQHVNPDLLRDMKAGEERPGWWIDLWYQSEIVLAGKFTVEKVDGEVSEVIELTDAKGERSNRVGLVEATCEITEVIFTSEGAKMLNLGKFEKGARIKVHLTSTYSERSKKWFRGGPVKDGASAIIGLREVGLVKPGEHAIAWGLGLEHMDEIKAIVKARTETRVKNDKGK